MSLYNGWGREGHGWDGEQWIYSSVRGLRGKVGVYLLDRYSSVWDLRRLGWGSPQREM